MLAKKNVRQGVRIALTRTSPQLQCTVNGGDTGYITHDCIGTINIRRYSDRYLIAFAEYDDGRIKYLGDTLDGKKWHYNDDTLKKFKIVSE